MAMVYLTDRKLNNDYKKDNAIEVNIPLPQKNDEIKSSSRRKLSPPFNLHGKGHEDLSILNNNPGPGSYNVEQDFIKPKLNANLDLHFLTKCPRFTKNNDESLENLGPGTYNPNEKPKIKKKFFHRPNSYLNKYSANSSSISSIPSKSNIFGYYENENGTLVQTINPLSESQLYRETKKTEKMFHLKDKNPIVKWNRMSARNLTPVKKENNTINNLMNDVTINKSRCSIKNESLGDISKISKLETDISFIKNSKEQKKQEPPKKCVMKELMSNYRKKINSSHIILTKKEEIEPIDIQREIEFLNYAENHNKKGILYPLNFNHLRYYKPEKEQFFGSTVERNITKLPITDRVLNPGPGAYFRETFNKYKDDFRNGSFPKSKRMEVVVKKDSSLGPGSYDVENYDYFRKKSFNRGGSFSCVKRFSNMASDDNYISNKKNISPGPGDYDIVNLWKKYIRAKSEKIIYVDADKEAKIKKSLELNNKKPDFNTYQNNAYINVLQTKIKSKINPYSAENCPFLSGIGRFAIDKDIEKKSHLGPGKYEQIKEPKNKSINVPFNSIQEKKRSYIKKSNPFISPAEYQKDSYFDWNKKSFNVMFV